MLTACRASGGPIASRPSLVQPAQLELTTTSTASSAPPEVQQWVAKQAIPIATVEAGHGFDDLAPLKDIVGDARIVALGEATHGTREFFQLKHRILELLVTQMGFTAFAIEASMADAYAIDEYVVHGKGDAASALAGIHFFTTNTEEVLAMIEWMRAYNADPAHPRKLRFYGFDVQHAPRAAGVALAYLDEVDRGAVKRTRAAIAPLFDAFLLAQPIDWASPEWKDVAADVAALARRFDERRPQWIARTDEPRFELARQHVRILEQWLALQTAEGDAMLEQRDRAMADNVAWLLAHEPPKTKMIVWAHNGHVATTGDWHPMGQHLRTVFGTQLIVFGFAFYRGGFSAKDDSGLLRAFELGPARADSVDALLATADEPVLALDLRTSPVNRVPTWLGAPQRTRWAGSAFSPVGEAERYMQQVMPESYDALLFVAQTTPSRVLSRSHTPPSEPAAAANLDFEDAEPGAAPASWNAYRAQYGFVSETSDVQPFTGKRSGTVHRRGDGKGIAVHGGLQQKIDAGPFLAQHIRLRAATRTELGGPTDRAYLWIRVDTNASAPPSSGGTSYVRIDHRRWREQSIAIDVSKHATAITFGIALAGEGQVWIDALAIDSAG
ncbi:MAG TPA: erythromycin esterase family protein [Nannocystaceae bacterium]|nr:erythromycin esterase family protein [Nannocystaceae bacterium]